MTNDSLITVAEAAEILDLSTPGVRHLDNTGQLPSVRTSSNQRRFRRADVEELALRRAQQKAETAARELAALERRIKRRQMVAA
jgi:excisionase family DNA binding protein